MNQPKAHILIVEDDPAIRNGLADVLVFNGYSVEKEEDGEIGLQQSITQKFDLILLDVMLPSLDGFTLCRKIREMKQNQPIIMLTAKGSEDDIVTGFTAGADDYISKPFSLRELIVRIEAILRRSGKITVTENLNLNGIVCDSNNLWAEYQGNRTDLTRKEMDILFYLHRHQSRIVSKKELLTEVWHYSDGDIETRTVDIHMLKLRKKLATLSGSDTFIKTIRGEGYRLDYEKT